MVTLNTMLLIGTIVAGVAVVATVAFLLLLGCYFGIKEVKKVKEDDESGVFTIPMPSLQNMAGQRGITQADVDRARAAMAQYGTQGGCGGEEKKAEYIPGEGAYI